MHPIRFGILGCGKMARGHVRRLQETEKAKLVALCDVSEEIIQDFMAQTGLDTNPQTIATFTDPAEMYARARLDAVVIVTPHTLHFEHGIQALDAGCHVYMEKPMVTSVDQAYKLQDKVKESGKVFVIGFNTPCTPTFRYLRKVIRQKTFGNLELVNGYLSQGWLNATLGTWRQQPELSGGGQAYDSGAHLLNSLVWSVEASPARVSAFIDNYETPVDINSVINIQFDNGVMASITISGNCPSADSHMVFIFDEGRIEIDGWFGSWIKVFDKDAEINPGLNGVSGSPLQNFTEAMLGQEEAMTSPMNGIHQSELMDAIYESARTGQVVGSAVDR